MSHDKLLQKLNPEQRAAVMHGDGPLVVLAGAGSGKTRVITHRIAYLIHTGQAEPEQILAVTFTNRAANEMRQRLAAITGKKFAARVTLGTFHAFCLRVLRVEIERLGYRKNFTVSSESDTRTIMRRVLDDMDGIKESFNARLFLDRITSIKNSGIPITEEPPDDTAETETELKYRKWMPAIYDRYQSALRAANALDFDDLLLRTAELWEQHPDVLKRFQDQYHYVLVDEYQDTNAVQYRLLRMLAGKRANLFVVGDDDQSVYAWRGADIRNILDFERDFPKAQSIRLEQNYRSTTTILEAANHVIGNNRHRRPKRLWSAIGEGRAIDHIITANAEHEAATAVEWIRHIMQRSGAAFRDFAVLYRSNLQSRPFEIAFRREGIPYVVRGGQDFFERTEVKDVLAYLRAIVNPRDESAFLRVVNVPRRGIGDATLHQIHDLCREAKVPFGAAMQLALDRELLPARAAEGIRDFLRLLDTFRAEFQATGRPLNETIAALIDASGYRDDLRRISKTPAQWALRSENLDAVTDAAAQYAANVSRPALAEFLDQCALDPADGPQRGEDPNRAAATLMTVHSAKGLEFPFVFITGVEEGLMPHEKITLDAAIEEERRLFYVALTRAQRHITLFESVERDRHGRPRPTVTSRFVAEIPDELIKRHIRAARPDIPPPTPAKPQVKGRRNTPARTVKRDSR